MSPLLAQIRREFSAYFLSPVGYVLLTAAMLFNGVTFWLIIEALSNPASPPGSPMQHMFNGFFFYLINLASASFLTMRLIAEERRSGTLETLLTAPISDLQVIVAKFTGAVGFFVALWVPTGLYVWLLSRYSIVDPGPIAAGYLGTVSLGAMFVAIGLFFSALTRNQIVAALLSFATNMGFVFISIAAWILSSNAPDSLLGYLSIWNHMEAFARGIVDTRHLVLYSTVTVFALFATVQVMQARRWR